MHVNWKILIQAGGALSEQYLHPFHFPKTSFLNCGSFYFLFLS